MFLLVAPSLSTIPMDQTILEAYNVTFHCSATGNPTPKITWIKDGKTVATGGTLSMKANRNHSGKYWCSADNGLNSVVNASANLDVQCKCKLFHTNTQYSGCHNIAFSCMV